MNVRAGLLALAAASAIGLGARAGPRGDEPEPVPPPSSADDVQDMMFLGENRPIFIRMRLDAGGKAFRSAWTDAVKAMYGYLDRDGDGSLTKEEVDRGSLPDDGPGRDRRRRGAAARRPRHQPAGRQGLARRAGRGPPAGASGRSACRSGAWPPSATMPCSTTSTATRTARWPGPSWTRPSPSLHRFDLDDNELIDRDRAGAVQQPDRDGQRGPDRTRPIRAGAAGDRAVVGRPVVPPGPPPAQEVRQRVGRGRVGRRQPAEPGRVRDRSEGVRDGRRRRATAPSTPRNCAGSSAGSSPSWS